ncbi:Solute carrier family 23 member 1 [Apostichopus japonicus]|uniref:Solute carrier family 23 member 1 n=1 Tax=Stichopus japonicus TaxID=307972 RepID=A0A2G8KVQ7_STIJA|nr:Solute carrier family 23 member 1 [Apostichopus japonicus]
MTTTLVIAKSVTTITVRFIQHGSIQKRCTQSRSHSELIRSHVWSLCRLQILHKKRKITLEKPLKEGCKRCIFLVILFSQFLDRYDIPLPGGRKFALFTFFPILLAVGISWLLCLTLTSVGAFPDDPAVYGYKARTDLYNKDIRDAAWFRFPYPGQFGMPSASLAGVIGMLSGVIASVVESVGDYHACALISNAPPPPVHAINRGIGMEGIGCVAAGLWGASCGYTSLSNNISAISLTKVASRLTVYFAAGLFTFSGILFKFCALCVAMPEPIVGAIMATTFGMIASIGFANLSFVKVNTSRNLFILGFAIFLGLGLPDYLNKNPGVIDTGSVLIDQILNVILGSNMFIGGLAACVLDNLVRGSPEELGNDWREQMMGSIEEDANSEGLGNRPSCYDLPFGMRWIKRTFWTSYIPFSPTFTGYRRSGHSKSSEV